ncbi:Hpt domain-containing protein [Stappia sp.]|uniref:Hpt domain-containing protein n=1 Tax=Stappia sp. TaxID=1870903 RepID=UPI003A9A5B64
MSASAQADLQSRLGSVRDRFVAILDERLDALEVLRDALEQEETRVSALEDIRFIVHKIAGTAGTLGFEHVGTLAARTETRIDECLEQCAGASHWDSAAADLDDFMEVASQVALAHTPAA